MRPLIALALAAALLCCEQGAPVQKTSDTDKPARVSAVLDSRRKCGEGPDRVSGDHVFASKLRGDPPDFQRCSIRAGRVVVDAEISTGGDTTSAVAVEAPNRCMAEAAVAAVKSWKFCPGEIAGRPTVEHMSFTFKVDDKP